ncbi:thioesterase family protein [Janibacter limosus]|uniref:thioesterase family protein n=1 Tax=Janibacter limosus TaxID=53458 RepID=UPI0008325DA2|nr:thioesterase family protein [Janibacter limosus]
MGSFYRQVDEHTFDSLPSTAGPWSPRAQHAGPPAALLARVMEQHESAPGTRLADVRLDILGPIPVAPLTVEVEVLRGGRSMQLLQATASADGRPAAIARAWRITRAPEDFPRLEGRRPATLEQVPEADGDGHLQMPGAHVDGYLKAIEWRIVSGGVGAGGTTVAWGRQLVPLVEGEEPTGWQRALVLADSGGGITLTLDPRQHTYINCDLHVALDRDPAGEWVRMDSQALASPGHGGTVHTTLADSMGELGTGLQTMVAMDARP